MKRVLCLLLAVTLSLGIMTVNVVRAESEKIETKASDLPFSDVKEGAWYFNSVKEAYKLGLMKADGGNNKFNPDGSLTRGMVATILYRMDGTNEKVTFTNKFKDVEKGIWYADAIIWASNHKIVSGYKNGNFGPDDNITRQDLCIMLYNYATYKKLDTSKKSTLRKYNDYDEVESYAQKAVSWAIANGIFGGSKVLDPTGNATRAQASKMVVLTSKVKLQSEVKPIENGVLDIDLMKKVIHEQRIEEVYFVDKGPSSYDHEYNLGHDGNDSVVGYINDNELYIATKLKGNKVIAPQNCQEMFYECNLLTHIDLSNLDTKKVTDMFAMFYKCSSLTSLDLSPLDTHNVTDMGYMFASCGSLTNLNLSDLNTTNVTNMSNMFIYCSSLTSLNLSSFNTSKVTDMSYMFDGMELTSLNLSNFNTSKVTDMSNMFDCCSYLKSLDISSFDTSNVTNMSRMFMGCSKIKSFNLSNFKTTKVVDMSMMFGFCSGLQKVDMSSFDTKNVTDMSWMFGFCSGLQKIDVSNFDTRNLEYAYNMFLSCDLLKTIDLSNFNTTKVKSLTGMFVDCSSLTKLNLSNLDTSHIEDMDKMFEGCEALESLNLTKAKLTKINKDTFTGITHPLVKLNLTNAIVPKGFSVKGYFKGYESSWTIITDGMKKVG